MELSHMTVLKQIQIIWLTTTDNIPDALPPEQENLAAAIWSEIDRFTE
jgi:hypothetical protein